MLSLGLEHARAFVKKENAAGGTAFTVTRKESHAFLRSVSGLQTNWVAKTRSRCRTDLVSRTSMSSSRSAAHFAFDDHFTLTPKGRMWQKQGVSQSTNVYSAELQCRGDGNCLRRCGACGGKGHCSEGCEVGDAAHRCQVYFRVTKTLAGVSDVPEGDVFLIYFPLELGHVRVGTVWDRGVEQRRGMCPWVASVVRRKAARGATPGDIIEDMKLEAGIQHGAAAGSAVPSYQQVAWCTRRCSFEERGGGRSGVDGYQRLVESVRDNASSRVIALAHEMVIVRGKLGFLLTIFTTEERLVKLREWAGRAVQWDAMHSVCNEFPEIKQSDLLVTSDRNRGSTGVVGLVNMERVAVLRTMLHCVQMAVPCGPACHHPLKLVKHQAPNQPPSWHHVRQCFTSTNRFRPHAVMDMFKAQIIAAREQSLVAFLCTYHVNSAVDKYIVDEIGLAPSDAVEVVLDAMRLIMRGCEANNIASDVACLVPILDALEAEGARGKDATWKADTMSYLTDKDDGVFGAFYVRSSSDAHLPPAGVCAVPSTANRKERDWSLQQRTSMQGRIPKLLIQRGMSISGQDVSGRALQRPSVFSVAASQDEKDFEPYSQARRRRRIAALALLLSGHWCHAPRQFPPRGLGTARADPRAILVDKSVVSFDGLMALMQDRRVAPAAKASALHKALLPLLSRRAAEVRTTAGVQECDVSGEQLVVTRDLCYCADAVRRGRRGDPCKHRVLRQLVAEGVRHDAAGAEFARHMFHLARAVPVHERSALHKLAIAEGRTRPFAVVHALLGKDGLAIGSGAGGAVEKPAPRLAQARPRASSAAAAPLAATVEDFSDEDVPLTELPARRRADEAAHGVRAGSSKRPRTARHRSPRARAAPGAADETTTGSAAASARTEVWRHRRVDNSARTSQGGEGAAAAAAAEPHVSAASTALPKELDAREKARIKAAMDSVKCDAISISTLVRVMRGRHAVSSVGAAAAAAAATVPSVPRTVLPAGRAKGFQKESHKWRGQAARRAVGKRGQSALAKLRQKEEEGAKKKTTGTTNGGDEESESGTV